MIIELLQEAQPILLAFTLLQANRQSDNPIGGSRGGH